MIPKEALQRFIDFVNSSKTYQVNTFVFYGYEIDELQKFLKEHKKLQECERELTELKRDVARFMELEATPKKAYNNNEYWKLKDKLSKVGKEDE